MKITVQNGAKHGLSRREAEAFVRLLPSSLSSVAKSLVLYEGAGPEVKISFHPKEQVIGLHWPSERNPVSSKLEAIEELLVALSIIAETGQLPARISKSVRLRHLEALSDLGKKCERMLSKHP